MLGEVTGPEVFLPGQSLPRTERLPGVGAVGTGHGHGHETCFLNSNVWIGRSCEKTRHRKASVCKLGVPQQESTVHNLGSRQHGNTVHPTIRPSVPILRRSKKARHQLSPLVPLTTQTQTREEHQNLVVGTAETHASKQGQCLKTN